MRDELRRVIVDPLLPEIRKLEEGQRRFEKLEAGQEELKKALERVENKLGKMGKRIDTMTDISSLIQTLTLTILKNITERELEKEPA